MAAKRFVGGRRRRLRRAATILTVLGLLGAVAAVLAYRASRPEVRRPGEDLPEITRKLARDLPPDAPLPRFADVTSAAGLTGFSSFTGGRSSQLPEDMGAGVAWGDFDSDGDDDLFLVSAGGALGLPEAELAASQLYENRGDGTFRRTAALPDLHIHGMGAAWGDADGDGRLDLAVSGYKTLRLYRGGEAGFVRDAAFPELPGYWAGLVWGDFDRDRDLDLYVAGYVRYVEAETSQRRSSDQYGAAVPYTLNPASFGPERNLLLRNQGDGSFVEVAAELGVDNPEGRSLGALWHDFNDDGWLDLYVANDISDNMLYLNREGRFEDVSLAAWVADYRGAMGLAAGDWNRDGDDDLFITHWVAQENALYDSLLRDAGGGGVGAAGLAFSDVAARLGLGQTALRFVGWGTELADLDNDGWLDVAIANGSTFETGEPPKTLKRQRAMLLWNRRGEYFHDLAPASEVLAAPQVGRGLALADYDADGDLDIAMIRHGEGVQLLRNDMEGGHWLMLRLRDRPANDEPRGAGEGALVIATAGGVALRRQVTGASYLSQSSRAVHFGLGTAAAVERLEVRWLGGVVDVWEGLAADTVWQLTEGEAEAVRLTTGEEDVAVDDRQRLVQFWDAQRAGMDAMKRDGDLERAIEHFREALALDPDHGDSRYYLANCLAGQGQAEEALSELAELRRRDPGSHRAHKQWGVLRALTARSAADLEAAAAALERSLEVNLEETGSLLVLGEIALLRGEPELAEQRLEWATRTNPRAVGGFYLRAYLAWQAGDAAASARLLEVARQARGEDWKPEGAVAEGDVAVQMHREETPLSRFWRGWDGAVEPSVAFGGLEAHLAAAVGG